MDSLSRPEFGKIFDRVSIGVELAGATTAIRIENRLKIETRRARSIAKDIKEVRLLKLRRFYGSKAERLDKLIEKDFAGRAIFEANRAPKEIIAQTLLHGRKEAIKRVRAQKKAAIRGRLPFVKGPKRPRRRWGRR